MGNTTEKVYDNLNRLYKVIDEDNESSYSYYENGSVKNVTYSNGCKEEYTYYDNNLLRTLVNKNADDSIMDSYSYTYDHAGNQLTKDEIINGGVKGTTSYTYDELSRLVSVMEPNGMHTSYGYDAVGNRILETKNQGTEKVETSYLYTNQNRLVSSSEKLNNKIKDITAYTYDSNGNQTLRTVASYLEEELVSTTTEQSNTYDFKNQLIKTVMSDGTIVQNTYDTEGYRIAKNVDDQTTYFSYDRDKVILEQNEDGDQIARNVYGINLLRRTVDSNTYYYMYNGHADVTALLTDSGDVAATYYYDAFGNKLESTGNVNNNILYSGYQYDDETNLYYLNSRMYDPVTARFMQQDTYAGELNDPLSLNLYTYVTNNPIMYTDPTGHKALQVGSKDKDNVKQLQQDLMSLGYKLGKADGKFGPATKAAVIQYQKDNGLKVDGKVGNQTRNSINYKLNSSYYNSYYTSLANTKTLEPCTSVKQAREAAKRSTKASNNVGSKIKKSDVVGTYNNPYPEFYPESSVAFAIPNPVTAACALTIALCALWPSEKVNEGEDELHAKRIAEESEGAENTKFPDTPEEMDELLGQEGKEIPDGPNTQGRNKVKWKLPDGTEVTYEQHPYDVGAPEYHTEPHYHVSIPGGKPHITFRSGDQIPFLK